MTLDKTKKHKASDIDFSGEGCHVSLVADWQGGAANGETVLLTKATKSITLEDIAKAADVTVELSMVDFLVKFFDMYYYQAEKLAVLLGYDIEEYETTSVDEDSYKKYVEDSVSHFKLMKSLKEDSDLLKSTDILDQITLLKFQEKFETLMKEKNSQSEDKVATTTTGEIVNNEVEEDVSSEQKLNKNKEDNMTDAIDNSVELTKSVEMEALIKAQDEMKSQIEALMKANQDKEAALAELQKAKDEEAALLKAKVDAKEKAEIEDLVKNLSFAGTEEEREAAVESLFKNRGVEGFATVVSLLNKAQTALDCHMVQKSVEDKKEKEEVSVEDLNKANMDKAIEAFNASRNFKIK